MEGGAACQGGGTLCDKLSRLQPICPLAGNVANSEKKAG